MRFKTLIVAIVALNIGLHALPAVAGSALKIGSSTSSAAVPQPRSRTLDQGITTAPQHRDEMNAVQRLEAREQFAQHRDDNIAYDNIAFLALDAGAVAKQLKEQKRTGK
jgi:hypothetical protein